MNGVGNVKHCGVGNLRTIKHRNRYIVLSTLLREGPLTKAQIASQTNLTFATVANIISEFESKQLVCELGRVASQGGRKATLYGINRNVQCFVGVDVQIEKIICAITNFGGDILETLVTPFDVSRGPLESIQCVRTMIDTLTTNLGISLENIGGIGISTPGPIDAEHGIILSPPNMSGWVNVPFREVMEREFSIPCFLERDANAAALGEKEFGAGRGIEHLVYVMVDVGIGLGIIINNDIYYGFNNGAGEIGHVVMELDGPRCNCGNNGCLEAVASGYALQRLFRDRFSDPMTLEKLISISKQGTNEAQKLLIQAGHYLGLAVANLCNLLNPQMVVFGGSLALGSDIYFEQILSTARKHILPMYLHQIRFERAELGQMSGVIGAASIAFKNSICSLS
jgi:predicted NBD/HSP70 family sugar kinase